MYTIRHTVMTIQIEKAIW